MHFRRLTLRDFRSHADASFAFGPGVNLVHGPNGAGKTNLLEAMHYLCLGKSFLTSNDRDAVRMGAPFFEVTADLSMDRRSHATARIAFVPGEGKRIDVGGAPLDRLVDVVGRFPIVIMAPADHRLTEDGPDERRRFLDTLLCQASPAYLDSLLRYRRVLRQRNRLLADGAADALRATYDAALVEHGARLAARRARFVAGFSGYLEDAYGRMSSGTERPSIRYRSFFKPGATSEPPGSGQDDGIQNPDASETGAVAVAAPAAPRIAETDPGRATEEAAAEAFREALAARRVQETERGLTLVGPHRDELDFRLDGLSVRRFASQGQHRTFVIGLRLAQYLFLADRLGERPVLLLDDVFDTLDPERVRIFSDLLTGGAFGQAIVTAARRDLFEDVPAFRDSAATAIEVQRPKPE